MDCDCFNAKSQLSKYVQAASACSIDLLSDRVYLWHETILFFFRPGMKQFEFQIHMRYELGE